MPAKEKLHLFGTPALQYLRFFQVYQTLGSGVQLLCEDGPVLHPSVLLQAGQEERGGCGTVQEGGGARRSTGAGQREGAGPRGRQKHGESTLFFFHTNAKSFHAPPVLPASDEFLSRLSHE